MTPAPQREESLFQAAAQLAGAKRTRFLEKECNDALAISDQGQLVQLWNWRTGGEAQLTGGDFDVVSVAFSPDGHMLAATIQTLNVALADPPPIANSL